MRGRAREHASRPPHAELESSWTEFEKTRTRAYTQHAERTTIAPANEQTLTLTRVPGLLHREQPCSSWLSSATCYRYSARNDTPTRKET